MALLVEAGFLAGPRRAVLAPATPARRRRRPVPLRRGCLLGQGGIKRWDTCGRQPAPHLSRSRGLPDAVVDPSMLGLRRRLERIAPEVGRREERAAAVAA